MRFSEGTDVEAGAFVLHLEGKHVGEVGLILVRVALFALPLRIHIAALVNEPLLAVETGRIPDETATNVNGLHFRVDLEVLRVFAVSLHEGSVVLKHRLNGGERNER